MISSIKIMDVKRFTHLFEGKINLKNGGMDMKIGEIIRKYRKELNLTQEEMAVRLGVTAPAVNKWEKGVSLPDITLLAPIARLLNITLETLLSFQEDLTAAEIGDIIKELDQKMEAEPYDKGFQYGSDLIHKYPNCYPLIWQIALVLQARLALARRREQESAKEEQTYCIQIEKWYLQALESGDENTRRNAAGSLFMYYLGKEEYEKAESYLVYFPEGSTEQKQKQALIYSKTNRKEEAYKAYEEILFSEYQVIGITLNSLFALSMEEKDMQQARMWVEKQSGLARLFDMGVYQEESFKLELAVTEQDREETYRIVRKMLDSLEQLCFFSDSAMYRHMKFSEVKSGFYEKLRKDLLKNFQDEETFHYMKGHLEWEKMILSEKNLDANKWK